MAKHKRARRTRKSSASRPPAPPARLRTQAKPVAKSKKADAGAADPLDDFIEAAARALALPVESAWQPVVKMNLRVILGQAALFSEFSLPDEAEPAPIFTA